MYIVHICIIAKISLKEVYANYFISLFFSTIMSITIILLNPRVNVSRIVPDFRFLVLNDFRNFHSPQNLK